MAQLRELGQYFPMQRGTFWFAAGISFNSFALVDGIAVVAVEVGDGLDINLLGLARMALPRPQVALVSIELALLVRFSSSRGRALGAGPAHRQLVAAVPGRQPHRRLRLRHLVQGRAQGRVRAHAGRLPPGLPPRRLPGGAAARPALEHRRLHRHQGRQLLRADLRGADGRRRLRGVGDASARPGPR